MRKNSLRAALAGSALAVTGLVLPLAGGHASAAPKVHGTIQILSVSTSTANNAPGKDIILGAIVDHGRDQGTKNPNVQKIVLSKGTFEVNTTKLNKSFKVHFNAKACTIIGTGSARNLPINHGTGAYKGITGTVTLQGSFAAIGKIVKGKCAPNDPAIASDSVTQGTGTVSY